MQALHLSRLKGIAVSLFSTVVAPWGAAAVSKPLLLWAAPTARDLVQHLQRATLVRLLPAASPIFSLSASVLICLGAAGWVGQGFEDPTRTMSLSQQNDDHYIVQCSACPAIGPYRGLMGPGAWRGIWRIVNAFQASAPRTADLLRCGNTYVRTCLHLQPFLEARYLRIASWD